jgi:hypothetical protein
MAIIVASSVVSRPGIHRDVEPRPAASTSDRQSATSQEASMKYVILIHSNPQSRAIWDAFSEDEKSEGLKAYAALNQDLITSGELVHTEALADASTGRRLPAAEGMSLASDGPFAEAKEQLAGFFVVDCDDFDRAVEIAGRVPESGLGLVEVIPTMSYSGLEM